MSKRVFSIVISTVFLVCYLFCGCTSEAKECYFCKNELKEGEHTINSLQFPEELVLGHKLSLDVDHRDGSEVVCESCQLQYLGVIVNHCMLCLTEFSENEQIYYGYESTYGYDFGVCDRCVTELWGDDRVAHLPGERCSVCGCSPDGCEYQNTGVCENCAEIVYN